MLTVGIDGAEHGIIVKHHGAIEAANVEIKIVTGRRNTEQTNNSGRAGAPKRVAYDAWHAGAFHQNIRLHDRQVGKLAEMKRGAKFADDLPLRSAIVVVEDIHVEPALGADHRGE